MNGPVPVAMAQLRRPGWLIGTFALVVILLGSIFSGAVVLRDRKIMENAARQTSELLSRSLERLTGSMLTQSLQSLHAINYNLYAARYAAPLTDPVLERALEVAKQYDPVSTYLFIAYEDRVFVVAYQNWVIRNPPVIAAIQKIAARGPRRNGLIGDVVNIPGEPGRFLPIFEKQELSDGSVVTAGALIEIESLVGPFRKLETSGGYVSGIVTTDAGQVFMSPGLGRPHSEQDATGTSTSTEMFTASTASGEFPLRVIVGIAQDKVLASWRQRALVVLGLSIAVSIAVVVLAVYLVRTAREQDYRANHDALTRLPNRFWLIKRLQQIIRERVFPEFAVLLVDLNRFKEINDSLGHQVGDQVLQEVAQRLRFLLPAFEGECARLGGDELAIILPRMTQPEDAMGMAARIQEAIGHPITVSNLVLQVGASIGVALYPRDGDDQTSLLRDADIAMYHAKRNNLGSALYSSVSERNSPDRLLMYAQLADALRTGEGLSLHFQPKHELKSGRLSGFEALIRWRHPERGMINAGEFIALAENTELIHPLTAWVTDQALARLAAWRAAGTPVPIAINVSVHNLHDAGFVDMLSSSIARHKVPPDWLELELTEHELMRQPEIVVERLAQLRKLGVTLSVDDFGTGYSSLRYLKDLPIQTLKLDRSFVSTLTRNERDAVIVRSTITMAHGLGLLVVAEGVEDQATMVELNRLECDLVQGYYISRPIPEEAALVWAKEHGLYHNGRKSALASA
jgi:diguanylate cyclase (GGDEF)-like protein